MIASWQDDGSREANVKLYTARWKDHCTAASRRASAPVEKSENGEVLHVLAPASAPAQRPTVYSLATTEKVWLISDIHVDFPENMSWLFSLPRLDPDGVPYTKGTLIIAGDVCHALPMLGVTLRFFKKKFQHVFYCVGNHELWLETTRKEASGCCTRLTLLVYCAVLSQTVPCRTCFRKWPRDRRNRFQEFHGQVLCHHGRLP